MERGKRKEEAYIGIFAEAENLGQWFSAKKINKEKRSIFKYMCAYVFLYREVSAVLEKARE